MKITIESVENGWIVSYPTFNAGDERITAKTIFEYQDSWAVQTTESRAFMYLLNHVIDVIGPQAARDGFGMENIYLTIAPGDEVEIKEQSQKKKT